MLTLLVALGVGLAQDYRQSVDIELVQLPPTCEAVAGVERAGPWEPCAVLSGQLEQAPLVLYQSDERVADLVASRAEVRVGLVAPLGARVALTAFLPVVGQWGSTEDAWLGLEPADGAHIGDVGVGVRGWLVRGAHLGVAARLDTRIPLGAEDAWVGERGFRLGPGLTTSLDAGHLGVDLDAALWLRRLMVGGEPGEPLGEGLASRAGLAVSWRGGRVEPYLAATTRLALQGAELEVSERPVEGLAGARVRTGGRAVVDAWLGRGLLRGVGTTTWRLGLAVRLHRGPRAEREKKEKPPPPLVIHEDADLPEAREERVVVIDMPLVLDEVEVAPAAPSPPDEAHAELPSVLLETLRFQVNTTELRPESVAVLGRLTADLLSHPAVGPILLEGHASEEGEHIYNYDLSLARADAIYRHLVVAGVQPRRLVLRGLGEVAGDVERSLEQRRRVEVRWILDSYIDAEDVPNPFTHEVDP